MTGDRGLAGRRILVVEDEGLIDVGDMLERNGCTVIGPAASCAAALALIGTDLPDAAVLDVQVRGGTTEPVADALLRQGCPFVVVTAYQRRHLPGIMKEAPLLRKPIDEDRLRLELSGLLAG